MQIYFHSRLWSYLPRVPILVEGTVYIYFFFNVCSRDMLQLFGKALIGFLWKYGSNSHRMHF